jgi:hypothetical protein
MNKLFQTGLAILAGCGLVGSAGFIMNSSQQPQPELSASEESSPHERAFEASMKLGEQEQESIRQKREKSLRKLETLSQKMGVLQNDLEQAKSKFKVAIDRAIRTPRQRAQQLLNDLRNYNASEAVFEARAAYSQQTAGYLGAIGGSPLPFPQRNPAYLDNLHNNSLVYVQSLEAFESDAMDAQLALEDEIGRVKKEFIELQLEVQNVETSQLDLGDLERSACERAINLVQSLGPFLTHDLVPALPLDPEDVSREKSGLSEALSTVAQWVDEAQVSTKELLAFAIESEFTAPVFVNANQLVENLARRGEP